MRDDKVTRAGIGFVGDEVQGEGFVSGAFKVTGKYPSFRHEDDFAFPSGAWLEVILLRVWIHLSWQPAPGQFWKESGDPAR